MSNYVSRIRLTTTRLTIMSLGLIVFLSGCSQDNQSDNTPPPVAVRVVQPQLRDMAELISYSGSVHATDEVPIIAQIQGTVLSLPIDEGERIHKGDLLIRLSAPDIEAMVQRLQADFDYWDQHLNSDIALREKGAVPQEQVDASRRAYNTTKASLDEVRSRLAKTSDDAPFDGCLLKQFVESSQHVMPGQQLLLVGNDKREVHVELTQEDIRRGLAKGTAVIIRFDGATEYSSRISSMASIASGAGRTFTAKILLPDLAVSETRVGEAAYVAFVLKQYLQTLAVPSTAIVNNGDERSLFLIRDNHAIKTTVAVLVEQSGWAAVSFDWNGTDLVATSNVSGLSDGDPVYPVQELESNR